MNRKNGQGKTLKKKMAQVQFREGDPNRGTEVEKKKNMEQALTLWSGGRGCTSPTLVPSFFSISVPASDSSQPICLYLYMSYVRIYKVVCGTISRTINPSINLIYCTLLDCTGLFLLTLAYLQYLYRARDTDLYLDTTTPPKPGFSRAGQTTGTDNPF